MKVFSSRGRLLWHIVEDHSEQNLLLCDQCGRRFGDRDQIREHDCLLTDRPSSAGADRITATSPDADRGSVPTSSGPSFSLVERARTPVPTVNLFNEMFPSKPHVDLPMGPLFPLPMPQFAHGPHHPPPCWSFKLYFILILILIIMRASLQMQDLSTIIFDLLVLIILPIF
uniref:C2H2-type domain-containing protein n=1 Tax=Heterorhabditis bacteriophora TaxID=37862 RepID=A0A1I7WX74_HETBA